MRVARRIDVEWSDRCSVRRIRSGGARHSHICSSSVSPPPSSSAASTWGAQSGVAAAAAAGAGGSGAGSGSGAGAVALRWRGAPRRGSGSLGSSPPGLSVEVRSRSVRDVAGGAAAAARAPSGLAPSESSSSAAVRRPGAGSAGVPIAEAAVAVAPAPGEGGRSFGCAARQSWSAAWMRGSPKQSQASSAVATSSACSTPRALVFEMLRMWLVVMSRMAVAARVSSWSRPTQSELPLPMWWGSSWNCSASQRTPVAISRTSVAPVPLRMVAWWGVYRVQTSCWLCFLTDSEFRRTSVASLVFEERPLPVAKRRWSRGCWADVFSLLKGEKLPPYSPG